MVVPGGEIGIPPSEFGRVLCDRAGWQLAWLPPVITNQAIPGLTTTSSTPHTQPQQQHPINPRALTALLLINSSSVVVQYLVLSIRGVGRDFGWRMNVAARGIDPMGSEMLFVNFNQDLTCLSVGTRHGYKIYNCEPFGKYFMKRTAPLPPHASVAACKLLGGVYGLWV